MSNSTSLTGSSKQYIGVVDMLCEGPIYGLEKGKNDDPTHDKYVGGKRERDES